MTTIFAGLFFGIGALVALWALACLVSALIQNGPIDLVRGYWAALFGKDTPKRR